MSPSWFGAPRPGRHRCPGMTCELWIDDDRFACPDHWRALPREIRERMMHAWNRRAKPGKLVEHRRAKVDAMRFLLDQSKDAGEHVEVIEERLLGLRVCTDISEPDKLTQAVRLLVPCGTSSGWMLSNDPELAPVTCDNNPSRRHVVFEC